MSGLCRDANTRGRTDGSNKARFTPSLVGSQGTGHPRNEWGMEWADRKCLPLRHLPPCDDHHMVLAVAFGANGARAATCGAQTARTGSSAAGELVRECAAPAAAEKSRGGPSGCAGDRSNRRRGVLGGGAPRSMKKADPRMLSDLRKRFHPRTAQSHGLVAVPHGLTPVGSSLLSAPAQCY